ncbi:MAG: hypothetical protein HQ483_09525 [Rhodospirillales bacterium]|nr:hypothetical protein [Rhodospirillales bacterium]
MLDFLEIPAQYELLVNLVFLACTGYIAWHGIRYRDEEGKSDFVRLLFGSIAGFFFFGVLAQDVLGLITF